MCVPILNILEFALLLESKDGPDKTRNDFTLTLVPVTKVEPELTTLSVMLTGEVFMLPPAFSDKTSLVFAPTR